MNEAVLLLGSNMGDRMAQIARAENAIRESAGEIIKGSKVYETASWGDETLSPFLNKVIVIKTEQSPEKLLDRLLEIEKKVGRTRMNKWESRKIDIDILFFGNEIIRQDHLSIPHPHLHQRKFTLVPLVEILPDKNHPVLNKTCRQLLDEVTDQLAVVEYSQFFHPG